MKELLEENKRLTEERDEFLRRCVVLEDELARAKKLLELNDICYHTGREPLQTE